MNKPIEDQMLYVSFNQDSSCFVIGTQRGFKIYSSSLLKNSYERIAYYYDPRLISKIKFEKREILYNINIESKSSDINNEESVYVLKLFIFKLMSLLKTILIN